MAHKMGLIQINMKKATAPETRTYTANSVSTAYDSGNVEFYALNVFDGTNLPYSATCPGTVSYFIVKYSSGNYSFTTPYKALNNGSTTGAVSQWTMSAVTAPASGKCTSATTSDPIFKNLGRLYSYTGTSQTYTPMLTGFKYQMECWGAQGGSVQCINQNSSNVSAAGGAGGYVSGIISLSNRGPYHVYVGECGGSISEYNNSTLSFNGGGGSYGSNYDTDRNGRGGGSTDIRLIAHSESNGWGGTASLNSRIIVASGGGGAVSWGIYYGGGESKGAAGGGLLGYPGTQTYIKTYYDKGTGNPGLWKAGTLKIRLNTGGTQKDGGLTWKYTGTPVDSRYGISHAGGFGYGGTNGNEYPGWAAGGGSGYWGGASSGVITSMVSTGAGGSSYISGHPGCTSVSGYEFTEGTTEMIDGQGKSWTTSNQTTGGATKAMPNPIYATTNYASGVGHNGNGNARITCKPYD